MAPQNWKQHFKVGAALATMRRRNMFRIVEVTNEHIRVSIEGPKQTREATLDYRRLDELYRRRNEVDPKSIRRTVNAVWTSAPRPLQPDVQNESQFWALVCARVHLESSAKAAGPKKRSEPAAPETSTSPSVHVQGFEADPLVRRAVELRAMEAARQRYPNFKDVSATRPFDLVGKVKGRVVHVEVKGSQTSVDRVLVTAGEVRAAKESRWRTDLVVVDNIKLTKTAGALVGKGGRVRVFEGWKPVDGDLEPIAYQCKLPDRKTARRGAS